MKRKVTTSVIGLDISMALGRISRWERLNNWLDEYGPLALGLLFCLMLAFALPHWLSNSSALTVTHGTAVAGDARVEGLPPSLLPPGRTDSSALLSQGVGAAEMAGRSSRER